MRHLLATRRARSATRTLATTTFCDACGKVCTPACRHDALHERTYRRVQESGLHLR